MVAASSLAMIHGVFLPQYAQHVRLQPGTRELIHDSWIGIQWHQDARLEMDIAAYPFPQSIAGRARQRCERPLYGLTGHLLLNGLARLWTALNDDFDLRYRVGGWCLLFTNLLYLVASVSVLYVVAARWLSPIAAVSSIMFLLSLGFIHKYVAICMTHMYIHLPPALLAFAVLRWFTLHRDRRSPSCLECAGWGLLFGVLYLYKPDAAVVLTAVAVQLLLRNFRQSACFVAGLPWADLIYRMYLHAAGVAYYNHNIQRYDQGVWILRSLYQLRIYELTHQFLLTAAAGPGALWRHFGFTFPLAAIGLVWLKRRYPERFRPTVVFIGLLSATVFLQAFASRRYFVPYMWGELYIVILPLAGLTVSTFCFWVARHFSRPSLGYLATATVVTCYAGTEYLKIAPQPSGHPLIAAAFLSTIFFFQLALVKTAAQCYGQPFGRAGPMY